MQDKDLHLDCRLCCDYETEEQFHAAMLLDRALKNSQEATNLYRATEAESLWVSTRFYISDKWKVGLIRCSKGNNDKGCHCGGHQRLMKKWERVARRRYLRRIAEASAAQGQN
ncbi:hypothetical protein FPQ18DRAFT_300895 [Pyronema domesticum]|nr:hypothetical protein FPQ18DRAFT_300895 [Pyronema domesticum]